MDWNGDHPRCLELINKTNQFNLNGVRWTESEWKQHLEDDEGFVVTVYYRDKFGPLGRIAVAAGTQTCSATRVEAWVMSCRAFSRRIEYQVLRAIFQRSRAAVLSLSFQPTDRNGPMQDLLARILGSEPNGPAEISLENFRGCCPALYGKVDEK